MHSQALYTQTTQKAPGSCSCEPSGLSWIDRLFRALVQSRLRSLPQQVQVRDISGDPWESLESDRSAATIEVHRPAFYRRVATSGSLGAAESYIAGDWSTPDLVGLIRQLARQLESAAGFEQGAARLGQSLAKILARSQRNTRTGSRRNVAAHYDLGNEFFALFLDPTMMYSSACFDSPDMTLEEASLSKLQRVCRRLALEPDDHLLEIGTGWGGLAEYAARHYGCRVTTTTISRQQFEYANGRLQNSGLDDSVTLLQQDYRDLAGEYDKLVSIEMIEAVGEKYLDAYFRQCDRLLTPGGRMLIQAIVMPEQRYDHYCRSVDFIRKHIFQGGFLPSIAAIQSAAGRATNLRLVGLEDFSPSYARTLHEWRSRFLSRLDDVRRLGFSEEFIRMWDFYFCYCEAAFHERAVGVVQMEWVKATNS